jgi:hypothetical protein
MASRYRPSTFRKDATMKQSHKLAAGIAAALGLGIAVAASAQPGQMRGGMEHGAQSGMQHGMTGGMGHGRMGGGTATGHGAGQPLMTPEERTALRERMRNAGTPEERQRIAAETRAEMQKRAAERGITPHEGRGPRTGATPRGPGTTEQH